MSCDGGVLAPERNPFGQDFALEGRIWTRDLCEKDSDGDGFTNGEELGDPCCVWHEGVSVPLWMTAAEWDISHPGFASSRPDQPVDKEALCKDAPALGADTFFNDGEEEVTTDFVIDEHVVDAKETVYDYVRFNFPEDATYHMVGMEPIVDNEEMVHHFVMYACSATTNSPGTLIPDRDEMDTQCEESIYLWGPGSGNFSAPKNAGIAVGKGTGRLGFELEIHYDNPLEKEGYTDASGVRMHLTPDLRPDEIGILWVGSITSVGRIPPKERSVFSTTVCQLKIDEAVAPGGITVYGNAPHMHFLGRRLWTDILRVKSEDQQTGGKFVTDLKQLEKVKELSREDAFDFNVQRTMPTAALKLRNGDVLATTCVYDSTERDTYTSGGLGSYDEMCINYLNYYPAGATDVLLYCSGPRYFGTSLPESVYSVHEIANISGVGTAVPKWRQAYLSKELPCIPTNYSTVDIYRPERSPRLWKEARKVCGDNMFRGDWSCSRECAKLMYNHLGCALLEDAVSGDGKTLSMLGSPMEITVESSCNEEFMKIYEEEGVPVEVASEPLLDQP
ncbi:unnamed protein product [Ostreobium quekettii]|uniref:Uncharacterized protein n=1 Tax=Ostreobium quekettii TaxID=121088 RepID=A0A8S1IUJ1_9CHLO|nr:unnamed protein product [Ostreobium quekettii]